MVRKLFRLLVLIALLIASLAFLTWNHLGAILEQFNKELPNGYSMTYQDRYLDIEGYLIITKPNLHHSRYGTVLSAGELKFKPSEITDYWDLKNNLVTGNYPSNGQLIISDAQFPIAPLSKTVDFTGDLFISEMLAQGCGEHTSLTLSDFNKMGFAAISGKILVDYQFDVGANNLKLNSSFQMNKFASLEWQFEFNDVKPKLDASPFIVYGQWVMYNPEFLTARDSYCAQLTDQSVSEFRQSHAQAVVEWLAEKNIPASDILTNYYQQFANNPENIAISFSPQTGIRMNKMESIAVSEKIDLLGVQLNINGRAIQPIRKKVVVEEAPKIQEPKLSPEEKRRIANTINNPTVSQLRGLIGLPIELEDENRKIYEGKISSVSRTLIKLEIRQSGGVAEVRFTPRQVKRVLKL
ncbi:MAG: hypothetical protein HWE13_03410 [Gammaproteobacteria bacterium]|nr:hypothetical protein [Gammaproteobacteria bacterium]NVK87141.1 hypothetical protein [Gammaproteobacteria bacterium]